MAEFNSYLLGKVRKSVGNITLYYTRKKNIVRAKVFGRKDNPTPAVLEQRAKVKLLGQIGRRLLTVIRKGFVGVGNGTTSNAFVSVNIQKVVVDQDMKATLDFSRLKVASGILFTPRVSVAYDPETSNYMFDQTGQENEEGFASSDDKVFGVLVESELLRVRLVALKARGESGSTMAALPAEWSEEHVHVYCFATTQNGRMASDSVYLTA